MNKKLLIILSSVLGVYILFLVVPVLFIPFSNLICGKIVQEIQVQTGYRAEFSKLRILTTPKLTAGAKLGEAKIYDKDENLILNSKNAQAKISLLPFLIGKIELDTIGADNIELNLILNPDELNKKTDVNETEQTTEKFKLPLGLKLSNRLPDIKIKNYNLSLINSKNKKNYSIAGKNTKITDFIFNKKVKIQSAGKVTLDNFEAFNFDIRIFNKLMPDMNLNDLLSASTETANETAAGTDCNIDVFDVLDKIKKAQLTADLNADLKITGDFNTPLLHGNLNLDKLSMAAGDAKLPESFANIKFKGEEYNINSEFYTSSAETTKFNGLIKTGAHPKVDFNCTSNAQLNSIFKISNAIAQIFGIKDLQTLSAAGKFDIDFNIKSDLKKINSNGYLKLLNGAVNWGLYSVKIDNIAIDIGLDNNAVLINKAGFTTLSIPFNIKGKIDSKANCDININTTSLPLKELLVSLGQSALLKENPVYSGAITLNANVGDKLSAPKITGDFSLNNLKLKNTPSDFTISLNPLKISVKSTKKGFEGDIEASNIKAANPAVSVLILNTKAAINEKKIAFKDTTVYLGKNQFVFNGEITDYLTDKIGLGFLTKSGINSTLNGNLNPYKMTLDIKFNMPDTSSIVIPGFDKSKLFVSGNVAVTGSMLNPDLKGQFDIPNVEIPEIPVNIDNMTVYLNGPILKGNATLVGFKTGGITANDISSAFKLENNVFYLENLKGSAFDGNFKGNIGYNLSTSKCDVLFEGANMSAVKAIEGAAGIKNAMSGTLKFNADINFTGVEYNDMMKTLKGGADFEVSKGVLANLGGLNSLLSAQNLVSNSFLKSAVQSFTSASVVQKTSEFDYIKGNLGFSGGYADISQIIMSGPLMSYYINGKYNLLNNAANLIILGRLSGDVVGSLGSLGDLSTDKLTSLIPGLGSYTSSLAKSVNESTKNVDSSKIPALSSSASSYKDFKAVISGVSVKSFKWINDVDTTDVDSSSTVKSVTEVLSTSKEELKDTANQAKDLFKSLINTKN